MKNIIIDNSCYEIQKITNPTQDLIDAYKNVFNNSAWKEGVKCSNGCGFKAIFEESIGNCPDCNGKVEDFYSNKEVNGFITDVTSKEYYMALQLFNQKTEKILGFTWGWGDDLAFINKDKLQLSKYDYKKLEDKLDEIGISLEQKQFYLSEIGVTLEGRGKGLGNILFSQIQNELLNKMNSILRTSESSPMFNMSKKLGYKKVFDYNDSDGRIIMASKNI